MNALKHGLRARTPRLLPDEDESAFAAFAEAVGAELRAAGALQTDLADRIAVAAWRARRADRRSGVTSVVTPGSQPRLEAALLDGHLASSDDPEAALGAGLIRDGHGPRALETR